VGRAGPIALWAVTCRAWARGMLSLGAAVGINAFLISILHEMVRRVWAAEGELVDCTCVDVALQYIPVCRSETCDDGGGRSTT
jgi:hypothetical protein